MSYIVSDSEVRGRLDNFVEELCRCGVCFSMCIDGNVVKACQGCLQHAIPYRPMGFQPDLSDYAYYVRKRRALLENPAVARAALMQGGLIWRIAMEHVPDSDIILSDSGHDTRRYENCHRIQRDGEPAFDISEESLSEDQIDLICGVYRTYRSASASPTFTQDLSWFPKSLVSRIRVSTSDTGVPMQKIGTSVEYKCICHGIQRDAVSIRRNGRVTFICGGIPSELIRVWKLFLRHLFTVT